MTESESTDNLKGIDLEVYRLILKAKKPLGIREIQRALELSSPSLAQYHLSKLEQAGFLKREMGNFVVNKVVLNNCVKINRFIVPKYLFYSIFALSVLVIELTLLSPNTVNSEYFFSTFATCIFALIFSYETVKIWLKGSL